MIASILPAELTGVVDDVLSDAGITHVAYGDEDPVGAAEEAVAGGALAVIGPFRSTQVVEALEITAPQGVALLAPVATWVGLTRDDEPCGGEEPAESRGTVLRMVARDMVVAQQIASRFKQAFVVAADHEYGQQLDEQLELAGLDRVEDPDRASVLVLCALADDPEIGWAEELAPLPVIAFDGVQGADLGDERNVRVALVYEPGEVVGFAETRRAAELVAEAIDDGATDRATLLTALRQLGRFDAHGDPQDPVVRFLPIEDE